MRPGRLTSGSRRDGFRHAGDHVRWREREFPSQRRQRRRISPPDVASWNEQKYQARVFQQLIYNADPNLGNQLITSEWRLWLIDFTRAFRTYKQLPDRKSFKKIDRQLYEALRRLDRPSLDQAMGGYLRPGEIKTLLTRRDRILTLFDKRIPALGESAVLSERPGH